MRLTGRGVRFLTPHPIIESIESIVGVEKPIESVLSSGFCLDYQSIVDPFEKGGSRFDGLMLSMLHRPVYQLRNRYRCFTVFGNCTSAV